MTQLTLAGFVLQWSVFKTWSAWASITYRVLRVIRERKGNDLRAIQSALCSAMRCVCNGNDLASQIRNTKCEKHILKCEISPSPAYLLGRRIKLRRILVNPSMCSMRSIHPDMREASRISNFTFSISHSSHNWSWNWFHFFTSLI